MLRSLFSGVSGLRNHQVRMDVIGNNIANVNTVAFKSGRVTFKEGFAQVLQGASRPPGEAGGINPVQIGLGMQVGSIDQIFTQGNIETTGVNTDLALQGDAFFVVAKGNANYYTRSGNFQLDADGRLVSPTNGFVVQGRMASNGVFSDGIQDIRLPFGQKTAAKMTTTSKLAGNVDSEAPTFTDVSTDATYASNPEDDPVNRAAPENADAMTETSITVYDSLGTKHDLKVLMWKTSATEWAWKVDSPAGATLSSGGSAVANGVLEFDAEGVLVTGAGSSTDMPTIEFAPAGAEPMSITLDPSGGSNGITQFAGATSVVLRDQDGYAAGMLQSFTIDRTGTITGAFTNGVTEPLAQIVLADFNNPSGLIREGDNMYATTSNSGQAVFGYALEGSQSSILSGALEMSNVDLAQEFTNMLVAQRGFQANGRMITTSDQMLEELVNLKR
jgi:flagellar hook protein FlgE